MSSESVYLYGAIIACEVAFWVILVVALAVRYLGRRTQLSRALLLALPVVDLLLLLFTAFDLRSGTTATFAHGLATAYVGFTVAFGGILVAWADQRFAHRFAGGPAPVAAPDRGWRAVRHEFGLWLRSIIAWSITLALLVALIAFVGDHVQTRKLEQWFRFAFGGVFLWFVFGPVWSLVFFRRERAS